MRRGGGRGFSMEREIGAVAAAMGLRGFRYRRFAPPAFPDALPVADAPAAMPVAAPAAVEEEPAPIPRPASAPPPSPVFALLGEVARHRPVQRPPSAALRPSRRPGAFAALAARRAPPQDS